MQTILLAGSNSAEPVSGGLMLRHSALRIRASAPEKTEMAFPTQAEVAWIDKWPPAFLANYLVHAYRERLRNGESQRLGGFSVDDQREFRRTLGRRLCAAQNALGTLRWLNAGERLVGQRMTDTQQLIYLTEGMGVIALDEKN